MVGLRAFAREAAKQIPFASAGISSYNTKIVAGTDVLVRDSGWDDNHIASARLDILAVLATAPQVCNAGINAQHFMRRAVVMGEGIHAVSPRVSPVILGKTLFKIEAGSLALIVMACR